MRQTSLSGEFGGVNVCVSCVCGWVGAGLGVGVVGVRLDVGDRWDGVGVGVRVRACESVGLRPCFTDCSDNTTHKLMYSFPPGSRCVSSVDAERSS